MKKPLIAFFGTPEFAVWTLESLAAHGVTISLIVAAPDAPKGRKLVMTPPPAKVWAEAHGVPVMQPKSVKDPAFVAEIETKLGGRPDLFVVAAYGKILPKALIEAPVHGTINVHPSLLPELRGPSPIESALLADMRETGVTIMRIDEELDHGPLLAQEESHLSSWPVDADTLGRSLAGSGGALIAKILPDLLTGTLREEPQDHAEATFTKKIRKEDGLMDLAADGYENFLKWNAYRGWPGSYFFIHKGGKEVRVSIKDATYEDGKFIPTSFVPEGKKAMTQAEFDSWSRA